LSRTVPDYFIWLRYISWIGYGNEILLINQWDGVTGITCKNGTICPPGGWNGNLILKENDMYQVYIIKQLNFFWK
jgi:hypothetical protein